MWSALHSICRATLGVGSLGIASGIGGTTSEDGKFTPHPYTPEELEQECTRCLASSSAQKFCFAAASPGHFPFLIAHDHSTIFSRSTPALYNQ